MGRRSLPRKRSRAGNQKSSGWAAAQRGVSDHIRAGQVDGTIARDIHPDHTAAWLTWMAERGMGQIVVAEPGQRDEISASRSRGSCG